MATPASWTIKRIPLPDGIWGYTDWPNRVISIDARLPAAAQRSTLAHELVHAERGPTPVEPVLAAREELAVEKAAARSLINVHDLSEALAESDDPLHVAEVLNVDSKLLAARMGHLNPEEIAYLHSRLPAAA